MMEYVKMDKKSSKNQPFKVLALCIQNEKETTRLDKSCMNMLITCQHTEFLNKIKLMSKSSKHYRVSQFKRGVLH